MDKELGEKEKKNPYLVHARIGKEQSGIIQRDGSRRVNIGVLISLEEIYKSLPDFTCCDGWVHLKSNLTELIKEKKNEGKLGDLKLKDK